MNSQAISAIALLLATFGNPLAAAPPPADSAAAVKALIANPPRTLTQLEAIVGPLNRDVGRSEDAFGPLLREAPSPLFLRLRAELAVDFYHQDPREVEDPALGTWRLDFAAGREECRRLLAAAAPQELELDGRPVYRHGELYFQVLQGSDAFALSWYSREPLFAVPQRSAEETSRLLADLAAVAREQFARAAVEKYFGQLQPTPGSSGGELHGPTYDLEYAPLADAHPWSFRLIFRRPAPAEALVKELGLRRPVVFSPDVHMRSRLIAEQLDFETASRQIEEERDGAPKGATSSYEVSLYVAPQGLRELESEYGSLWSIDGAQLQSVHASPNKHKSSRPLTFPVEALPAPAVPVADARAKVSDSTSSARYGATTLPTPKRLNYVAPQYTELALRARVQGVVILEVSVDPQGRVVAAKVLKGLPMGLDGQARQAVLQWRYEPTRVDGQAVEVLLRVTLDFSVR